MSEMLRAELQTLGRDLGRDLGRGLEGGATFEEAQQLVYTPQPHVPIQPPSQGEQGKSSRALGKQRAKETNQWHKSLRQT